MNKKTWKIYLSGEIHSDWRDQIVKACQGVDLPVEFFSPQTHHQASDDCGEQILGPEAENFWKDHKSARINAIHNTVYLREADFVVVRFGEKYKQWNAAFDAGFCAAHGKPFITLHPEEHIHALKEVNAAAYASARTTEQVVELLKYVIG